MASNLYILASVILLLGYIFGRLFRRIGLTEVLAYLVAGVVVGPLLHLEAPKQFASIITGVTLSFVAYRVGSSFSFSFVRKMGTKVLIILVVEVAVTALVVWGFVYLLSRDMALSVILGALAPATAPAGTVAVLRDMRAKGTLTDISIAVVGLDDAAGIIVYAVAIVWVKMLLGEKVSLLRSIMIPTWEIVGAVLIGGAIGIALALHARRRVLTSDHLMVLSIGAAILCWGVADAVNVSAILACMVLGTVLINLNQDVGDRSNELMDYLMTPAFILFFASIGMEIDPTLFVASSAVMAVYCVGRVVGKIVGCGAGAAAAKSEKKVKKYLGLALLNQAGVQVGLAFLAAHELAGYMSPTLIITLMASTTAIFQIFSPIATQYAIKKAGEGSI